MKQKSAIPPTLGRNIRYVLRAGAGRGQPRAAIITATWEDIAAYQCSEINLTVFLDLANDPGTGAENCATSVPYDPDQSPGTWHWPADAGETFRTLPPVRENEAPAFVPNPPLGDGSERAAAGISLPSDSPAAPAAGETSGATPPAASNDDGTPPDQAP